MSEESTVAIVKDDGHRNQWGVGRFLYRDEGLKKSLNSKALAGTVSSILVMATTFLILTDNDVNSGAQGGAPIPFNEQISGQSMVEVPAGQSDLVRASKPKSVAQAPVKYSGLQVIKRPNIGKIPPGTFVKARFLMGASNGTVKAALAEPLVVNGDGIADEGTVLIGQGSSTEDRLMIQFSKMVFKDGSVQQIQGQACDDSDQTVGVRGKKLSKYAVMLAAGAGLNFLGGLAEGLEESQTQNGVTIKKNDLRNAALHGASVAALDQSKEVLTNIRQSKNVIQVERGKEFYIIFDGE
jgi:hypothetical protein